MAERGPQKQARDRTGHSPGGQSPVAVAPGHCCEEGAGLASFGYLLNMRAAAILLLICSAIAQVDHPRQMTSSHLKNFQQSNFFSHKKLIQDGSNFGRGGRRKVLTSLPIFLRNISKFSS